MPYRNIKRSFRAAGMHQQGEGFRAAEEAESFASAAGGGQ